MRTTRACTESSTRAARAAHLTHSYPTTCRHAPGRYCLYLMYFHSSIAHLGMHMYIARKGSGKGKGGIEEAHRIESSRGKHREAMASVEMLDCVGAWVRRGRKIGWECEHARTWAFGRVMLGRKFRWAGLGCASLRYAGEKTGRYQDGVEWDEMCTTECVLAVGFLLCLICSAWTLQYCTLLYMTTCTTLAPAPWLSLSPSH